VVPGYAKCKPEKLLGMPTWVPDDLPLPEGIYATATLKSDYGYRRAWFVIPGGLSLRNFTRFILKEWPKAGYQMGRGDSEPGEVESQFVKAPAAGAFVTRDLNCNPPYLLMYLAYAPKGPIYPSPSPTGKPSPTKK
jgi:hypothetical protein